MKTLPFAVFDEFGRGADDRVQDYVATAVAHAKLICREFPCNAPFEVGDGGIDDESERELAANAWADGWNACRAEFMKRLG